MSNIIAFTPQHEKGLKHAIDECIMLLPNDDDWAILQDRDVFWVQPDFKQHLKKFIEQYPNTGIFTTYATRCSYQYQVPKGIPQSFDVRDLYLFCSQLERINNGKVKQIKDNISGHVMVIKKGTWLEMREDIMKAETKKKHHILGVDTLISKWLLKHNRDILLMRSICVYHYFRSHTSKYDVSHII